jgi:putative endonuclease
MAEILEMPYFVYMILCEDQSIYVGLARDPEKRYAQHLAGVGAKYTRSHPPRRILGIWQCEDMSQALRLERYFKSLTHAQKLYAAAHHLRQEVPRRVPLIDPESIG